MCYTPVVNFTASLSKGSQPPSVYTIRVIIPSLTYDSSSIIKLTNQISFECHSHRGI